MFCGIDWAEDHHDIALVNRDGQLLARLPSEHRPRRGQLIRKTPPDSPGRFRCLVQRAIGAGFEGRGRDAELGVLHTCYEQEGVVTEWPARCRLAVAVQVPAEPVNNIAGVSEDHRQCSFISEQPHLGAGNGVCQPACVR